MHKLSSLCRRLRRVTGIQWAVIRHSGPGPGSRYSIFSYSDEFYPVCEKTADTVAECELFLLEQFR